VFVRITVDHRKLVEEKSTADIKRIEIKTRKNNKQKQNKKTNLSIGDFGLLPLLDYSEQKGSTFLVKCFSVRLSP